ncbi:MAG TPA: GyrI-like domain-containing protein [Thermoanaerobaculia bacterium]|nr:GyrI-like domain-containing protein [Thermoanaerobaculia bacterium]
MPHLVTLAAARETAGIAVRTNNAREQASGGAGIGSAWQQFYARDLLATLAAKPLPLGVYTDYESDAAGEYTLVAAVEPRHDAAMPADLRRVTIPAGAYLVFEGSGEMPRVVMDTWGEVWRYFAQPGGEYRRAYATDFEEYVAGDAVRIYIGVVRAN